MFQLSQRALPPNPSRSLAFTAIVAHSLKNQFLCIAVLFALVTYFWWPALINGQVIVHGDAAHHGFSLITMLHDWLNGELDSLLWSTGIYGGHPLFAESQGGFLNPINVLAALLFEPVQAFGFLHWLNMFAAGVGAYTLCRILEIDCWSSLFAALALSFSACWLVGQSNLTVSGTLVWMSWTMAAVQFWLKAPSLTRASLLAIPAAFIIYAGYPHFAYGLVVYFACFGVAWVVTKDGREYLAGNYRKLIIQGLFAVVAAIGVAAVQLLPLMELVQYSHRSDGVDLAFGGTGLRTELSGLFFFSWYAWPGAPGGIFGVLSASLLALLAVLLKLPHRVVGHLLGAILLLNLGIGHASPLFALIYEHGLIPGLRSFRIMTPFQLVGCVGLSVLAAYSICSLAKGDGRHWSRFLQRLERSRVGVVPALLALSLVFLLLSYYFFLPETSVLNYVFAVACLGSIIALLLSKRSRLIPPVAVFWLVTEIVVLRNGVYNFYDASLLAMPETVSAIKEDADHRDYNAYNGNSRVGFAFLRPNHPKIDKAYARYLSGLVPFPALTWGIPSLDGALALNLRRHSILSETLQFESTGESAVTPGNRLIDILGVRYFSFNKKASVPGFSLMLEAPGTNIRIYRNQFAKPKFQVYPRAVNVESPEQALAGLQAASAATLFIEAKEKPQDNKSDCPGFERSTTLSSVVKSSQHYSVLVNSQCSGWLFIRDAYYPGWHASVNGNPVDLYAAQVLGKAVPFSAGSSKIEVAYSPRSFYIGAIISSLTLVFLCGTIIWCRYRSSQWPHRKNYGTGTGL